MTVDSPVDVAHAADEVTAADAHPVVARVRNYADSVLRPAALRTDSDGVTPERIDELSVLGLLNHQAPADHGGAALGRNPDRRIHEIISGACFNTWLVWAQHAPMVGRLLAEQRKGRVLSSIGDDVVHGRVLVGAAVSDVRRFPDHFIRARRHSGGWEFAGTISWVSGWGLNSALVVSAVESSTERVITALVPVGAWTRSTHLDLSAVAGSRTERVTLDRVYVPEDEVLTIQSLAEWRIEDLDTASDARAQHFGLAQTVLAELEAADHPGARRVAEVWRPRIGLIRAEAYGLADEAKAAGDGRHRLDERLAVKVASGEALTTITRALLVARSGRGIGSDDTAQLHARSALFVLVQGQSVGVRSAQLAALAR
ncbi:acyl-CoA dehydrogenase family protein [Gordonia sp. ABSL11-1]|uniref:acyl-CoA dehydrogenase family protein n=1 Tax=Gordonia sp. ABSL11-1 TaxID=3053924 RepID=UPI002573471A|nr:acyl-CoA dehydrogenase family protein [Gordonia sp. ABSL11-1]MDL9945060.1 acyl-CoA dehydrogenase family protein [Gordonia sp. ABSL11-1]